MHKVWLSTTYYLDERMADMTAAEEVLFTRLLAFCGASETEGYMPARCWLHVGLVRGKSSFSRLVRRGVIEELPDGRSRFPAWAGWQEDGDNLVKRRKSDRDRKRKERALSAAKSRDMSRDVTPLEEKRGEENRTVSSSAAGNVASATAPQHEPSTHFADGTPIPGEASAAVLPIRRPARATDGARTLARLGAPDGTPRGAVDDLAGAIQALIDDPDVHRPDLEAAIATWWRRPGIGVGLLRGLVLDAAKARAGGVPGGPGLRPEAKQRTYANLIQKLETQAAQQQEIES